MPEGAKLGGESDVGGLVGDGEFFVAGGVHAGHGLDVAGAGFGDVVHEGDFDDVASVDVLAWAMVQARMATRKVCSALLARGRPPIWFQVRATWRRVPISKRKLTSLLAAGVLRLTDLICFMS